jgi:hypothetical protein
MKDVWDRTLDLSRYSGLEPTGLMVNRSDWRAYAKAIFSGDTPAGTIIIYNGVTLQPTADLAPGECAAVIS